MDAALIPSQLNAVSPKLIMMIGPRPDNMKPGIHRVGTHWIRGFMAFQLVRRIRAVRLMMRAWPESGFPGKASPVSGKASPVSGPCRPAADRVARLGPQRRFCGTLKVS